MNEILSKSWKWIILTGAFLLSFLGGKMIGKSEQKIKQAEANLKQHKKGQKIEGEVIHDDSLQSNITVTEIINKL